MKTEEVTIGSPKDKHEAVLAAAEAKFEKSQQRGDVARIEIEKAHDLSLKKIEKLRALRLAKEATGKVQTEGKKSAPGAKRRK